MKLLVTGATGFIGSALVQFLTRAGHGVTRLVRSPREPGDLRWDPEGGGLDTRAIEGFDGVVHLAGEDISSGRWTEAKKARIRDSRVKGTRLLAGSLAGLSRRPRALVCASAIGYYGDRGDERLTEDSPAGKGFLAGVCREWEAAALPAAEAGIRVVHVRFGIVLGASGGALGKMLTPFKLGMGGPIGSGQQYVSWIAIDDAVGAIVHALTTESLRGPANTVAPGPVRQLEFAQTLGRVLGRPSFVTIPAFAARLMFGEMADEALLASARVEPARLLSTGYRFRHQELEEALRFLLSPTDSSAP